MSQSCRFWGNLVGKKQVLRQTGAHVTIIKMAVILWLVAGDQEFGCLSPMNGIGSQGAGTVDAIVLSEIAI